MVMICIVFAAFEQPPRQYPLGEGLPFNYKRIFFYSCSYPHLQEHPEDGLSPVALLVGKAPHSAYHAGSLTEGRQDRHDREQVRTLRCIGRKTPERRTLDGNIPVIAVILRQTSTGIHKNIHNAQVRLDRPRVQS